MKVFIDAHQGEHVRTFLWKVSLIKVQSLLCADEDLGDSGGFWGSISFSSSSSLSFSPCNLLPAITNPSTPSKLLLVPKHVFQQPDHAGTQEEKHSPNGDFISFFIISFFFLVAIYVSPEGPKWPITLLPTQRQLGTGEEDCCFQRWGRAQLPPVS